jgi:hypothetical protein
LKQLMVGPFLRHLRPQIVWNMRSLVKGVHKPDQQTIAPIPCGIA